MSPCLSLRQNSDTIHDHEKTSISIVQTMDTIEMTVTTYTTATTTPPTTTQTMSTILSQATATPNAEPPTKAVLKHTPAVPPQTSTTTTDRSVLVKPNAAHAPPSFSCGVADQSINTLMLSTSVPIKIGNKIDNIDRETHSNKNNRIRYTFGLNTRKKCAATDVSKRTASAKFISTNSHKSMEQISTEPLSLKYVPSANALRGPNSVELQRGPANELQRAVDRQAAVSTVLVSNMNERGSKLVKQTTIDYYV